MENKQTTKGAKKSILFITGNRHKLSEFRTVLGPEILVVHERIPCLELRADTAEEIAVEAGERLCKDLGKALLVEDSGFVIPALNGFPGTSSKYIFERIKNEGIIRLMEPFQHEKDRVCFYDVAIAYCRPGKKTLVFSGKEKGIVASAPKGKGGWGFDPLFIPLEMKNPSLKTYGELREQKKEYPNLFRLRALEECKRYMLNDEGA